MVVKYLDPYKDDPYGKLRGDKAQTYFKINFDEGKIYATDNAYILAAHVTGYTGIVRSFKPENPLLPGLCAIPIYGLEYEIRSKNKDGKWEGIKTQPSAFEEALYEFIKDNENIWQPQNSGIGGEISFVPDGMTGHLDASAIKDLVFQNCKIQTVPLSGKLPAYTPPSNNAQRRSNGYVQKATMDEKMTFIKKEIVDSLTTPGFSSDNSLGALVKQYAVDHPMDEVYFQTYFDLLAAIIK